MCETATLVQLSGHCHPPVLIKTDSKKERRIRGTFHPLLNQTKFTSDLLSSLHTHFLRFSFAYLYTSFAWTKKSVCFVGRGCYLPNVKKLDHVFNVTELLPVLYTLCTALNGTIISKKSYKRDMFLRVSTHFLRTKTRKEPSDIQKLKPFLAFLYECMCVQTYLFALYEYLNSCVFVGSKCGIMMNFSVCASCAELIQNGCALLWFFFEEMICVWKRGTLESFCLFPQCERTFLD